MKDNILKGADINAGDGGYRIGTMEGHETFAKNRRLSIIRERFNAVTVPNFSEHDEKYQANIADHWETFQEGWEEAVKSIIKDIEPYEKDSRNHISYIIRQKYLGS